jgi:DNA polymerase elongation subunit (family B)
MRGQGAKILSLVSVQCKRDNFAIPPRWTSQDQQIEGALVLEPETGVYMEDPIVVLDFISVPVFHHRDEHVP